jgi:hypothetical protein
VDLALALSVPKCGVVGHLESDDAGKSLEESFQLPQRQPEEGLQCLGEADKGFRMSVRPTELTFVHPFQLIVQIVHPVVLQEQHALGDVGLVDTRPIPYILSSASINLWHPCSQTIYCSNYNKKDATPS